VSKEQDKPSPTDFCQHIGFERLTMRLLFATATSLLMTANMAIANPMGFIPDGIIIDGEI